MGGNERNENNRIVLNEVSLLFSLSLSTCLVLVIIAGCALSELATLLAWWFSFCFFWLSIWVGK